MDVPLFPSLRNLISANMDSASSQQLKLSDLPIGALSHVSSFLVLSSRALFAVALNYCSDIDSSSAIVSDQRDAFDFGDIEKELAAKLTDDDVKGVLLSIDAINNLKTLRLTNCTNITGIGLEPLRGSTMIEKIDLSLVGDNQTPELSPAPPISCTEVLPILDSIIDMGGACSLKLLIFPEEWRKERNTESEFHAFLVRYSALWRTRVVSCLKCHDTLIDNFSMSHITLDVGRLYGTQDVTCYGCMKHYCHNYECGLGDDGQFCMSSLCGICKRRYCFRCSWAEYCNSCDEWFCEDCIEIKICAQCDENTCLNCVSTRACRNSCCEGKIWCNGCVRHGDAFHSCENCDAECCVECFERSNDPDNLYSVTYCECGFATVKV